MKIIRDLLGSRELLYFLAWRDVKVRYKQTILGAAWAVLQPFVAMIVFTLVFAKVGVTSSIDAPPQLIYYTALVPWTYFAGTLTNSGMSLVTNTDLLTKVYFPRVLLPAATALAGLVDLTIASALMLGLLAYYGVTPDVEFLALPLCLGVLVALALGAGMLIAAINVVYRDVKYALPFAVQLLLFLSAVIVPLGDAEGVLRSIMLANPLTGIIEGCRAAALPSVPLDWSQLGVSAAITAAVFVLGARYFARVERAFADLV